MRDDALHACLRVHHGIGDALQGLKGDMERLREQHKEATLNVTRLRSLLEEQSTVSADKVPLPLSLLQAHRAHSPQHFKC
jgi:uncharacterized protein YigA (DUF484 family)